MHVFMTGATGFIGRAVVLRFLPDGHSVTAWVRDPRRARAALGGAVSVVLITRDNESLQREVERADTIISLAGEPILGKAGIVTRWTAVAAQLYKRSESGSPSAWSGRFARPKNRPASWSRPAQWASMAIEATKQWTSTVRPNLVSPPICASPGKTLLLGPTLLGLSSCSCVSASSSESAVIANRLFVGAKLREIFAYRQAAIAFRFGCSAGHTARPDAA